MRSKQFLVYHTGLRVYLKYKIEEQLGVEALAAVIMNFNSDGIEEYGYFVSTLERIKYQSKQKKLELDIEASRVSTGETIY